MNILVVGSGAREHAIAWKLAQSPRATDIFVAPGNAGTALVARNLRIKATDVDALLKAAKDHHIDLTVVGPEGPLAEGIVDRFRAAGLAVFGPTQKAAQIEASKVFSKGIMQRAGIPTGFADIFSTAASARAYIAEHTPPCVVKADGLAAGKGVTICRTRDEALKAVHDAMETRVFGAAGDRVLIEEFLSGREVSLHAFVSGESVQPMPSACDYKRVGDGDKGQNTGGMGAYSPPGWFNTADEARAHGNVTLPVARALAAEGTPYCGVLYPGLMVTPHGARVLEFNCRFGDPETQVILPRLRSDLLDILLAVVEGRLDRVRAEWRQEACVGIVLASGGYPGPYKTGFPIHGLDDVDKDVMVFHAGTRLTTSKGVRQAVTDGGRVLTVAALGRTLAEARRKAYDNVKRIQFQGCHHRNDIAAKA